MKYLFTVFCLCSVISCKQDKQKLPDIGKMQQKEPEETVIQTPEQKTFHGLFVVGKNTLSFRSCSKSEDNYFVLDSTHQMRNLYKTIFLNSPAFPFEYVYVEFKGTLQISTEAIAQRGFDSSVVVSDILTFEQKNYRNTCIPYDFWALGNEPNWSLQVSAKEGIVALKDYSANTVYLFEYFAPRVVNDEVFTYYSNNYANQTSISAIFKRMTCSDGMSENEYEYAATVFINGKRYAGCGIRGSEVK